MKSARGGESALHRRERSTKAYRLPSLGGWSSIAASLTLAVVATLLALALGGTGLPNPTLSDTQSVRDQQSTQLLAETQIAQSEVISSEVIVEPQTLVVNYNQPEEIKSEVNAVTVTAVAVAFAEAKASPPQLISNPVSGGYDAPAVTPEANNELVVLAMLQITPEASRIDPQDELLRRPMISNRTGARPADPTAAPSAAPKNTDGKVTTYTVAEGDTISGIAEDHNITIGTLQRVNGLTDESTLSIGQTLTILPVSGYLHAVENGDTIIDLADRYGVIPEDIVDANHLASKDSLALGLDLIVPLPPARPTANEAKPEVASPASAPAATPEPAKVEQIAGPVKPAAYTVADGDTTSAIAMKNGISVETLTWANSSLEADSLQVGQTLTVPPVDGVLHQVEDGDTLFGVAARYDTSAADIAKANGLNDPYTLSPGNVLVVPNGKPVGEIVAAAPTNKAVEEEPIAAPTKAPIVAPIATPKPAATVTAKPAPTAKIAATATAKPAPTSTPKPAPTAIPKPVEPAKPAPAAASSSNPGAANIAMRYVGYAYIWGGSSPSAGGFDCSGLTSYAFRQAGNPIPRDLWGQMNSGDRVSRANLAVGDLVFFANTYTAGLSHVGIYVGGGQFVHAASERTGVTVTSLNDSFWGGHYYGATRP